MSAAALPTPLVAILHLLISTIGVIIATAFAWYATQEIVHLFIPSFDHPRAVHLLLEFPGFPLQWLQGLFLGFVLAKRLGGSISQFTWVLPLGLATIVWLDSPLGSELFGHFAFDGTCQPDEVCFARAVATLLVVSSVAYSLGAMVGMKRRNPSAANTFR